MNDFSQKPLVSIVTVNYNNAAVTCDLIKTLKKSTYKNIEIIVVDNASKEAPDMIKEQYPEVTLVKNTVNKGFAGGNNDGFRVAKGKYFFMLNNDIEVPENFLEPLITLMENNPEIGVISPKICYYHNPDTIQFAGGNGINIYTGRGRFTGKNEKDNGQFDHCREIVHGHGAAMLLSREAVQKIGLIYEDYFLYYEELDYCEQMKKAGYKVWYAGSSVVYHKESASVGKENPLKVFYQTRNRLLYAKRNVEGLPYLISMLYFFLIAVPKNSITYLAKNKMDLLKAYYKGIGAYLKFNFVNRL
jgi:hypothetical protein